MPGTLYLVATPIGNLDDMPPRVAATFGLADFVAAEDTRVTLRLLNHLGLKKPMVSYYEHALHHGEAILNRIEAGENCALCSDAGMPCISDPGEQIVREAHERGIRVVPIPAASACVTALAASGQPSLGDAAQLLEEAEQYELLPEVAETWDYAELMARETYPDLPSELFQTPQAAQIGRTMLEEGNGAITEYGLIRRTDGQPLPVFTGKPQREEFAGPQMTGM